MKVDFFLIGFQKCATTWVYKCLYDHPEINMSNSDEVHFFDINYHKGNDFQNSFYTNKDDAKIIGESTSSYIRSSTAAKRIFEHNPNAKFIVCMRNPVERAFSHFWHEKKKNKINYSLEDTFNYSGSGNYDLFNDVIETGIYIEHIKKYLKFFELKNFHFIYDFQLNQDVNSVIKNLFTFLNVNDSILPSSIDKRVNKSPEFYVEKIYVESSKKINFVSFFNRKSSKYYTIREEKIFSDNLKFPLFIEELVEFYSPYNSELSKVLGVEFNKFWKK